MMKNKKKPFISIPINWPWKISNVKVTRPDKKVCSNCNNIPGVVCSVCGKGVKK